MAAEEVSEEELQSDDNNHHGKRMRQSASVWRRSAAAALSVKKHAEDKYYEFWKHYPHYTRMLGAYNCDTTLRAMGYPERLRCSSLYLAWVVHLKVAWAPNFDAVREPLNHEFKGRQYLTDTSPTYL